MKLVWDCCGGDNLLEGMQREDVEVTVVAEVTVEDNLTVTLVVSDTSIALVISMSTVLSSTHPHHIS